MTHKKMKHILAKAAGLALSVSALLGILINRAPTSAVQAADGAEQDGAAVSTSWTPGDAYALGSAAIQDGSYVYMGHYLDKVALELRPILNRVLDADHDNAGGKDAVFLMTENALPLGPWFDIEAYSYAFKYWDASAFTSANVYGLSPHSVYAKTYKNSIFMNEKLMNGNDDSISFIRPITKTDSATNMKDLYTTCPAGLPDCTVCFSRQEYYFEVDEHLFHLMEGTDIPDVDNNPYFDKSNNTLAQDEEIDGYTFINETQLLQGHPYFLLSIEEIAAYLGSSNLTATDLDGNPVTWVTRTGLGETQFHRYENGRYVAGIDASGHVISVHVEDETVYSRLGFNVEKSDILYTCAVSENSYQMATLYEEYRGEDASEFKARILGNDGKGVVTLEYQNTYNPAPLANDTAYVSVMVIGKDKDGNDRIKGYTNLVDLTGTSQTELDTRARTVQLSLPPNYSLGDTIRVFWESKPENGKSMIYTSNFVDLTCLHNVSYTSVTQPNCVDVGHCDNCGEDFGDIIPHKHQAMDVEYWYSDESTHWKPCAHEFSLVTTPLTHRVNEAAHTFVFDGCKGACSVCGYAVEDATRCNYDENGFCTHGTEGHYETPTFDHDDRHQKFVYVEKLGHWFYMADVINNGREVVLLDDVGINYHYYIPGEKINVVVTGDLDFTEFSFVPLGKLPAAGAEMQDTYFKGALTSEGSEGVVIKGIYHNQPDDTAVGLLGYAKDARVFGITLLDSTFKGASKVGALVGYGQNVSISNCVVGFVKETAEISEVVVSAADGSAGAFIGYAEDSEITNINLHYNLALGVRDTNGTDLAFTSSATPVGELTVGSSSFCLFAEDGELGCTSAATFASGAVAYKLGLMSGGWSQLLDVDTNEDGKVDEHDEAPHPLPRYVPKNSIGQRVDPVYSVYAVTDCAGNIYRYTNTVTRYGQHVPETVLEWRWDGQFCEALVICKECGQEVLMDTHEVLDTRWAPVRGDYTAYLLDPLGNYYCEPGVCADEDCPCEDCDPETCTEYGCAPKPFSDTITIIGIHLEDVIAMEQWVVDYTEYGVSPEELMNNHRLDTAEYEVYFRDENGNMVYEDAWDYYGNYYKAPAAAVDAGTYDLVVVGKNDYEGQEYTFEDVLTINPIVVELEPQNVYKYDDGNASFAPSFRFLNPAQAEQFVHFEDFTITYGQAPSSAEGVYTVSVSVEHDYDEDNIRFVLTRDTVQAAIVPYRFVEVENKSYPDTFEYGDTLPTPTPEHFTFTEGSTLTFAWYKVELEEDDRLDPITGEWITGWKYNAFSAIDGLPKEVGDYVLRVTASGVGDLAGTHTDVVVTITPATGLTLEIDVSGLQIDPITGYYILEMGQTIPYTVTGFKNGETLETSDVKVEISYDYTWGGDYGDTKFPTVPSRFNYRITYTLKSENYGVKSEYNDSFDYFRTSIYAVLVVGDTVRPAPGEYLTTDGEKSFDVYFTWPSVDGATSYDIQVGADENYENLVKVDGPYTEDGNNFAKVSLTRKGYYYVTVRNGVTEAPYTFAFRVSITDPNGKDVTEIGSEMGGYTVTVVHEGREHSAVVKVRREIVMYVKECEHNLDSGDLIRLDPTRVIMEAGKVIRLDHTLVEILARVNTDFTHGGEIKVESIKVIDRPGNDVSDLYSIKNWVYSWDHDREDGYCVAHIFDNACDPDCNALCNGEPCEYTRVAYHSGGEATCLEQAVCDKCHTPYGEVAHDNHLGTATHIAPNGANPETHLEIYSCCGQTKEVMSHVEGTPATCTHRAVCAECGWAYGTVDPANHASDETSSSYVDEAKHRITHLCCGATEEMAHRGGKATCQTAATCEDCNHAYGALDPHNHAGEITYSEHTDHANMHVEFYACCQVSSDVSHSGGTATCTDRAVCEGCRQAYGDLDPHHHATDGLTYTVRSDNGSMHDVTHTCCGLFIRKEYHDGGTATCTSAAICDYCGEEYGSQTQADNHESDELIYRIDSTQPTLHIAYHACCGKESHREDHTGGTATCTHGKVCDDCGYEYGERLDHEFDNVCDSICNVCQRQVRSLVFHVDANADGVCDHCATPITGDGLGASAVAAATRAITESLYAAGGEAAKQSGVTLLPLTATVSEKREQAMAMTCVSAVADAASDRRILSEIADEAEVMILVASLAWNPVTASATASGDDQRSDEI